MSQRIRGQEVTVQLVVDGNPQAGSFAKLERFKWSPRADLPDSDFIGETESEPDTQHHGFDFSFTIHQEDSQALDFWTGVVSKLQQGTLLPNIAVVVIKKYRDPAILPRTITFQRCSVKLDEEDVAGRKDYVKNSFSGKCKRMQQI